MTNKLSTQASERLKLKKVINVYKTKQIDTCMRTCICIFLYAQIQTNFNVDWVMCVWSFDSPLPWC